MIQVFDSQGRPLNTATLAMLVAAEAGGGTPGQMLTPDGSGGLEWVDVAAGGNGLEYVTTLSGQPTENTDAATLATVATTDALVEGDYLLKFTAMIGTDSYRINIAHRVNAGSDIRGYAGPYNANRPFSYAVKQSVSDGDTISLRAACSSTGYGAFATLEIWRIV